MRLNSWQALYVKLGYTAYYSKKQYQESAENNCRNPICVIFHFQKILDEECLDNLSFQSKGKILNSMHFYSNKQKTVTSLCPLSQCWFYRKSTSQ